MSKNNPYAGFVDREALREEFEKLINAKQHLYNLVRKEDGSYFSLHTERAWETFQLGFATAMQGME